MRPLPGNILIRFNIHPMLIPELQHRQGSAGVLTGKERLMSGD
jgi:hypothetical protein